jgi:hypothetical protein
MLSSDQAASILAVIAQEQRTVAFYGERLKTETRRAWKVRFRALRRWHVLQIKRWREELKA